MKELGSLYYDKIFAKVWQKYMITHKPLFDFVQPYMKGKILDLGCGFAPYHTAEMDIVGVDFSEWCVKKARELNSNGNYVCQDIHEYGLDYETAIYDTICLFEVVEHLKFYRDILLKVQRLVKLGGSVLITVPIKCISKDHIYPVWTIADLMNAFAWLGRVEKVEQIAKKWWFLQIIKIKKYAER